MVYKRNLSALAEKRSSYGQIFGVKRSYRKLIVPFTSLFCIVLFTISSCTTNNIDKGFPKITHLAFQTEKNGKWGMVGVDGKVLFENQFEIRPSYAVEGVFRVREFDEKRQIEVLKYYSATKKPELIGDSLGYIGGGMYSEGIIPVVPIGGRIHYITITGDTAFSLQPYEGKEIYIVSSFFSDQRAWFMLEDSKYGFIDPQGSIAIPPIYDKAYPFCEGKAVVYDKKKDRYIVIDVNGNELFEINANGKPNSFNTLYYNGYCVIGNFLCDTQGRRILRMPEFQWISPFNNGIAVFQDKQTELWKLIDLQGNIISYSKYQYALGIIDSLIYVGNTAVPEHKTDDRVFSNMDICALNRNGEEYNRIENVSRFSPLYDKIVVGEKGEYYFADRNGIPINNESYANIMVPPYTYSPGFPYLWTFLCAPYPKEGYKWGGVGSGYFDDQRTIGSILSKLTNEGFGQLRIGQEASEIAKMLNKKELNGWVNNVSVEYGINRLYATCSVGLVPPGYVMAIDIKLETGALPIGKETQRIPIAIKQYIEETLKFKKDSESPYLYRSENHSYDIMCMQDEPSILLLDKSLMK